MFTLTLGLLKQIQVTSMQILPILLLMVQVPKQTPHTHGQIVPTYMRTVLLLRQIVPTIMRMVLSYKQTLRMLM